MAAVRSAGNVTPTATHQSQNTQPNLRFHLENRSSDPCMSTIYVFSTVDSPSQISVVRPTLLDLSPHRIDDSQIILVLFPLTLPCISLDIGVCRRGDRPRQAVP